MEISKGEKNKKYVIGVDGGGMKTVAALADLKGKVLTTGKSGSASPRNIGFQEAIENVALAIKKVLRKRKNIVATFLGLPCLEEEFKFKKEKVKKELSRHKEVLPIFRGRVVIGSDQLASFRSGTEEKEGICLIAGSGQVVHGWSKKKEVKVSGWGYLTEKGSAIWVGRKALEAIFQQLDGSGPRTLIRKLVFQKLRIKDIKGLLEKVYPQKNSEKQLEILASFSVLVDLAAKRRDRVAREILKEAAKELAKATKLVIKKLNFQKRAFPLVLIGGVFKSKVVLDTFKAEIKKEAPKVKFIRPKKEPVIGAVKVALEHK